jgi:hypothetical protein
MMPRHDTGMEMRKQRRMSMNSGVLGGTVGKRRSSRAAFALLLVGGVMGLTGACSGDDEKNPDAEQPLPSGEVNIDLSYPDSTAMSVTAVIQAWVLAEREGVQPSEDRGKFNCASLIGGTLDPYDITLMRLADVAETEDLTQITAPHVAPGEALVYVEARDFGGNIEFAGCAATTVGQAAVSADIELSKAKVFDCDDPDTEDDSPCDDGLLCTVGETCNDGTCGGGAPRDCSFGADGCHAGTCSEGSGCSVQPLANGTPCDDDLFCTEADVCTEGECSGTLRDCLDEAGSCEVPLRCDEQLDTCVMTDAPFATPCDDGLFCTVTDQCDSFGFCSGTARDCSTGVPTCQINAGCDETLDSCTTINQTPGVSCNDGLFCTELDQCDGLGACSGTPIDCSGLDDECNLGVCDELAAGCDTSPRGSGIACNVGVSCTLDTCNGAGTCTPSASPRPEFTLCDDGDENTTGDECDAAGNCSGI